MKKLLVIFLMIFFVKTQAQTSSDMLEKAIGGVVTVAVYKSEVVNRPLGFRGEVNFPLAAYEKALDLAGSTGSGSGFIYSYKGKKYVVTNAHVIENAADEDSSVFVFSVDRSRYPVKVLGGDTFYDIAVLEFLKQPGDDIRAMEFKKAEPRLGEPVFAIGNPLGEYPYSVSDGIISAKNRIIKNSYFKGKFGFLQTTATLIWGNSGGPLVDAQGYVAGVNSQIAFAPSGEIQPQINFALEAALSERLVREIIDNNGRVVRAYFGIEASSTYRIIDGAAQPTDDKVRLSGVIPGSPAFDKLNEKVGAVITSVNSEKIVSTDHLLSILESVKPNQGISMQLERAGRQEEVKLTARELKTYELEDIAKYVIEKNEVLTLDPNQQQVVFNYEPQSLYGLNAERKTFREKQKSGVQSFLVLAAGIAGDDTSNIYKILNLRDLGATIKLSSMSGVLDFCVVRVGDENEEVKLYRQYLSGDERIKKASLYY